MPFTLMTSKTSTALAAGAALAAAFVTAAFSQGGSVQLITKEEAQLPAQKGAFAAAQRGITRGPKIQIPEQELGMMSSPIRFQVNFQTFGGSSLDIDALKVTYLKSPNVDLTPRVRPFVKPTGIDMPDAQLPPGDHALRIDIRDSEGRTASTNFVLKVAQ